MLARFDRNVLGGTEAVVPSTPVPQPDLGAMPGVSGVTNEESISEENVQAVIKGLRDIYPPGAVYPAPYRPNNPLSRPYTNCDHCAGWAMLCSDAAFGNLPWRYQSTPAWDNIRAGDLVRYDNSSGGHVVVVVDKTDDYIRVTESGTNNKVRWSGKYFKWWLEEQPGYALWTRYP